MNDSPRPVLLDLTDGVATVTLNRPEAMNALDVATKEALLSTLREVAAVSYTHLTLPTSDLV